MFDLVVSTHVVLTIIIIIIIIIIISNRFKMGLIKMFGKIMI